MAEETRREERRDRDRERKRERERERERGEGEDGISSEELFLSRKGDARAHPGFPGEDGT